MLTSFARASVAIYEREGRDAAASFAARMPVRDGMRLSLVDESGSNTEVTSIVNDGVTLVEALTMGEAVILHYDHSATSFTVVQGTIDDRMPLPTGTRTRV